MIDTSNVPTLIKHIEELEEAIKGLYEIAVIALPGSFIQTDSRMREARRVLGWKELR